MAQKLLFSAIKNEGPFLLEWVAYHRLLGFDRLVIVSNDCSDGSDLLLDALAGAGLVEHWRQDLVPGASAQGQAAALARAAGLPGQGDWALWLDADEFLNIHVGQGLLADLIAAIGARRGMLIPWRLFGDGGAGAAFVGRVIDPRFCRAAAADFAPNREVKTLFRQGDGVLGFAQTGINRPLLDGAAGLRPRDFLTARGETLARGLPRNTRWLAGEDFARTNRLAPREFGWDLAQINHYSVRTPAYFALKARRGRGWKGEIGPNSRHTPEYYQAMNRNDCADDTILRHRAALDAALAALLADPAIAKAQALVGDLSAKALAALADLAPAVPAAALAAPVITTAPTKPAPIKPTAAARPAALAAPKLTLPAREAALLRRHYARAGAILEYGSGGSTLLAAEGAGRDVFAVESDGAWCAGLQAWFDAHPPQARLRLHHADIGPTGAWGHPVDDAAFRAWPGYALSVWERADFTPPDVVLIDGRFRLACFLTTLMLTPRPVTILWDDYTGRPAYHRAEALLAPAEIQGRMARFEARPAAFAPRHLGLLARSYLDPA